MHDCVEYREAYHEEHKGARGPYELAYLLVAAALSWLGPPHVDHYQGAEEESHNEPTKVTEYIDSPFLILKAGYKTRKLTASARSIENRNMNMTNTMRQQRTSGDRSRAFQFTKTSASYIQKRIRNNGTYQACKEAEYGSWSSHWQLVRAAKGCKKVTCNARKRFIGRIRLTRWLCRREQRALGPWHFQAWSRWSFD